MALNTINRRPVQIDNEELPYTDGFSKTYRFGIDSVIKVQRKNPVGFTWFVPLTHFAGLVVLFGFFEALKKDLRTSPKNRMM